MERMCKINPTREWENFFLEVTTARMKACSHASEMNYNAEEVLYHLHTWENTN